MISRLRPVVRLAPAALALFVSILVLPGLGAFGLWEPDERRLAEAAAAASAGPDLWAATAGRAANGQTLWPALGMSLGGLSEGAARLPGALFALAAVAAIAWAGAGLVGRRAGLLAAAVLATTPLYVLQARQLTSDAPVLLGHALALGGLARLLRPGTVASGATVAVGAAGLALGTLAAGVMIGLLLPLAAGLAAALAAGEGRPHRRVLIAWAGATAAVATVVALAPYTVAEPSWLLGGMPRGVASGRSFETLLRVHGFGLFPYAALAPLALLRPLADTGEAHPRAAALLPLLFAGLGLAFGTLQLHLIGEARLLALGPAALAAGVLLDELLGEPTANPRLPLLAGLFAALGALLVARDLAQTPEALASLHLPASIRWPPTLDVGPLLLGVGLAAALACVALASTPAGGPRLRRALERAQRLAPAALLAAGGTLSLALAHHLVPALSRHLSDRHVVDSYHRHRGPEAGLAVLAGAASVGAFSRSETLAVPDVPALADAFRRRPSLFALVPRAEIGALFDHFSQAQMPCFVADASSSRLLLLSARPLAGVPDQSPLRDIVWRPGTGTDAPPWPAARQSLATTLGGAIEIVGADLPETFRRPGRLPVTLHLRVITPPPSGYSIFVHLERPGVFLNGDHPPLEGMFPTARWRPGDRLRDRHQVDVPLVLASSGSYAVFVGFWPGGNTTRRLPVTAGPSDGQNRVRIGTVLVR